MDFEKPVKSPSTEEQWALFQSVSYTISRFLKDPNKKVRSLYNLKTIYEQFHLYTEEEIDLALKEFAKKDSNKELLVLRYGEDYKKPMNRDEVYSTLNQTACNKLQCNIRKILKLNKENKTNKEIDEFVITDYLTKYEENRSIKFTEANKDIVKQSLNKNKNFDFNILELAIGELNNQIELEIIFLTLGLSQDRVFTFEEAAAILKVESIVVKDVTINFLKLYKNLFASNLPCEFEKESSRQKILSN